MKRYYISSLIFICMLLANPFAGSAQQGNDAMADKIKAAQIAYMTQKLDLTSDEAQKFWPVYNQYSKEVEALVKERQDSKASTTAGAPAPDELSYEQRMLDIKTRYNREFAKVLPAAKVSSVFRSEREFRGALIRQLRERQNMGGPAARRFRQ
jgi:hypothetical protein